MFNKILNFRNLTSLLLGLIACGLSFRELKEPDLWWQLRTGEWMLENNTVTKEDVFSFTHEGVEWINIKWGFEVFYAWLSGIAGPEIILTLQAMVAIGILLLLSGIIRMWVFKGDRNLSGGVITITLLVFLIVCGFRLNARPEMFSHLLLAVYLWVFTKAKSNPRVLWLLIPMQAIWTNMHEAYGMGAVLILIYSIGKLIDWKFLKQPFKPVTLLPAFLAILTIGLNPRSVELYAHPFEIFSQLGENQFTTELYGWTNKSYYDFAGVAAILLSLYVLIRLARTQKQQAQGKLKSILNAYGSVWVLLLVAFVVLGIKSHRNIPFMMIVLTPFIAQGIANLVKQEKVRLVAAISLSSILMITVPTNIYYKTLGLNQRFGYKVSNTQTPIGAASFLQMHGITGKGFTDYFSSSYLLWKLQPDFKTYLDLRDLDIFPAEFMTNVQQSYLTPDAKLAEGQTLWQFLDGLDQFDYVVLLNSENFMNLNRYLVQQDPNFELVYADPLSSVFLRKGTINDQLISALGFNNGQRNVFHNYAESPTPAYGEHLLTITYPGYNYEPPSTQEVLQLMNAYYAQIGFQHLANKLQPIPQP